MGTRRPHVLVDTTPAKTILVYRNGDAFFVGRRLVVPRRRVPTFEALLQQLTEQVDVPFGVRRLFTPTRGHPVRELQALQAGGNYIHIVPRKPGKMSKLKEIKPVVHCDLNVPSRWQTFQRTSRHVNVFTNGRLFIPPVKIIIPKFSLTEWNSVLAMIGEKVFPLGGVQKLFTMNGHLLDNSKDLQDNHFYVAAGPETFKYFPYWKSSKVPSEVQRKYVDIEKYSREKKKEDSKGKETHKYDSIPRKERDSVFYARAGKKKTLVEPSFQSGSEGDVFRAQTPSTDTQEAPEVKEDSSVQVEVPVDQTPAEIVTEDEEIHDNPSDFESIKEDNSRMSFKKRFSLRHSTKEKEKEPYDLLEGKNTPVLLETPVKIEDRRQPPMGRQSREESSSGRSEEKPEDQELLEQPSWGQPSQEQIPDKREPSEQSSLTQSSQEQIPDTREPSYLNSHRWGKKR
ncbi:doublecortin domain-containing protein 2C isoform X2 [Leopardus geoffroyi]|uniref:doublecortin domain-containing protein 2C isoform X2 n=1 Tax=Leopardus geoffroyi TaxID=46844 RepID=UPI001E264FB3|nr:doublecortin domain-containing protein 2C isoform X2 [Leopardus geoffroyi]